MRRAICSGSFDPVTMGHIDIFERASRMFDELIVCVFVNAGKKGFLPVERRVALIEEATAHLGNVRVDSFSGLVTDYLRDHDASFIVRGIRSVKDLEYEQNEAYMINKLSPEAETVFLLTRPEYSFYSSSAVRELVHFGAPVTGLVPPCVERELEGLYK